MGFGQIDQEGNVNVSKPDGVTVTGDSLIAQNAKKLFVALSTPALSENRCRELSVEKPGEIRKLVQHVDQITFSGKQALNQKQEVIYATESIVPVNRSRAYVEELAPGVELENVLQQMDFVPLISKPLKRMDSSFSWSKVEPCQTGNSRCGDDWKTPSPSNENTRKLN